MKVLLVVIIAAISTISFGQSNNPYDQKGIASTSVLQTISSAFKAGTVQDFTQASIDNYINQAPLGTQITVEMAATVVEKLKSPNFNLNSTVDNSSLSTYSKGLIKDLGSNVKSLTATDFQAFIESKVDEVNNAPVTGTFTASEKEMVLSVLAMSYNFAKDKSGTFDVNVATRGTLCDGNGGIYQTTGAECGFIIGLGGAVIGWAICGPPCALGGFIIGALVGGLSSLS